MKVRLECALALIIFLIAPYGFAGGVADDQGTSSAPAATTVSTGGYTEAPMLAEMVSAGTLPSVDLRLPNEPAVVEPLEGIGKYGGIIQTTHQGPQHFGYFLYFAVETLFRWTPDLQDRVPNIAERWELSPDARTITIFLREGMKWSDGEPFTADDFVFWYEDVAMNEELFASPPGWLVIGGQPGRVQKVDDYTVRMSFLQPYSVIVEKLIRVKQDGGAGALSPYVPRHYFEQFHPAYTAQSQVDAMVKQEGFDTWRDFWFSKHNLYNNPDMPTVYPWVVQNTVDQPIQRWRRNAYYYKVDPAGNQLPYIDGWDKVLVQSGEAELLRALSGETDVILGSRTGRLENFPVIMDSREQGNFRLVPYIWPLNNIGTIFVNYHHDDPVLRDIYNDKRFRMAVSHALNRSEMNELVCRGLCPEVSQPAPPDGPPYHGESELFRRYATYDPDAANRLLDEMGLTSRDSAGYRLRPDGARVRMQILYSTGWPEQNADFVELYKKYLATVGIEIVNKPADGSLVNSNWAAGEYDLIVSAMMVGGRPVPPLTRDGFVPSGRFRAAPRWYDWIVTQGRDGEQPPADVLELLDIRDRAFAELDTETRNQMTMRAYEIHADNLWIIGGLSDPPRGNYIIFDNRIRNVREEGVPIETSNAMRETWYFE